MRRRHERIIRSGALARVRSEGRLVFGIALCWADYGKCTFRMSVRGAATVAGVHPTTVRRGLTSLSKQAFWKSGQKRLGSGRDTVSAFRRGGTSRAPPGHAV
jgi:hypothetical protein